MTAYTGFLLLIISHAILNNLHEISTFDMECLVERLIFMNGLNWLCSIFMDEI